MKNLGSGIACGFDRLASTVTRWTGSAMAFGIAFVVILVWAILGPLYHYSETWQLVVNTGTTIITFLMVFLIQQSQNKDSHAVHLKLDELLRALEGASNRLMAIEDLDEEQLHRLSVHYQALAKQSPEGVSKEEEGAAGAGPRR
jgi:low affinity Fe/Cu permease